MPTTREADHRLVPAPQVDSRRLTVTIVALAIGAIASILDATIVNVAVDHLSTVFAAELTTTQWVVTGFLLSSTAVVPLSGWVIDRFGGRRTWILALSVFLLGSILCGLAWDLPSLIVFRIVQGLAAGLILPTLMTLLTRAAGKARLMTAMASFSMVAQVGPILGPVVGGALIEGANWRWLFLINIPLCAAGLVLAVTVLPTDAHAGERRRLDRVGILLLTPAVALVVYGVSNVDAGGDVLRVAVWLPFVAGTVLLGGFVGWSLAAGAEALIDVRLFLARSFSVGSGLTILAGFTMFAGLLLLPLYFQQVRGASVVDAGLLLVPQGVGAAGLILFGKKAMARVPARWRIIGGFTLIAIGTLAFAFPRLYDTTWLLIGCLVVRGIGIGAANPAINAIALVDLPAPELARGTAAFNIVQRIGAPFGTTVVAIVLAHALLGTAPAGPGAAAAFSVAFWVTIGATVAPILLAALLPSTAGRH